MCGRRRRRRRRSQVVPPPPPCVSSRRVRREETPACVRQSPDGDRGWTRALNHHDISRMDGPRFKGAPVTCFTRRHKRSEAAAAIATVNPALSGLPADKGRRLQDATRHHRWEVVSFTTTEHTATRLRLGAHFLSVLDVGCTSKRSLEY